MIIEHRTYTVHHGQMQTYLARYEEHALPLQMKHLGRLLGSFTSEIGPLNEVLFIWAYDSLADLAQRRAALDADPAWQAFKQINLGSFTAQTVKIMRGTSFCPQLL